MRVLVGIIAVVMSVCAWSDAPAPSSEKDVQKKNSQPPKDKSQSDIRFYLPYGTKESPVVIEPIVPAKTEAETEHQEYEHHEKPSLDRWLTYGTAALAGITAVLAYFTYGLWKDAKEASWQSKRDMRRSLAIGVINARATKNSADAAVKSAKVAEIALIISQRAYMSTTGYTCEKHKDIKGAISGWTITVECINSGNTPAHNLWGGVALMEIAKGKKFEGFTKGVSTGATVVCGPKSPFRLYGFDGKDFLTFQQAQQLLAGEIDIYLCARIEYNDMFPETPLRTTDICMKVLAKKIPLNEGVPFTFQANETHNNST